MKFHTFTRAVFPALFFILINSVTSFSQCPSVIWGDEFDGSSLDLNKWSYQIGDGCQEGICGWGNNELQYYRDANVTLSNGQLHITAKKERVQAKSYTSGRIRSINKGDWTYGRFEARMKLPPGRGLWPAFWMLPTDETYGGWPQSGEIDIMEHVSADPTRVLGTIHYGDPYPNNRNQGAYFTLNSGGFGDAFHTFAIEWEAGVIRWFVDDILYLTKTAQDLSPYNWPFDQRFHFLLNMAVGGNLGGPVDDSIFPKVMDVEYVRVYNGFKPYITGKRVALNQEQNVTYNVGNVANNTSVTWSVPPGATIVSGQGTTQVTVNLGGTSGDVVASFNSSCGAQQLALSVFVEPPFNKQFSFENFDEPATVTLNTFTGTLAEVQNPSASGVNTSALVGRYTRNSTQQYDVLVYNVTNIQNANEYSSKQKKFYMDVYTAAPVGTEILLQLETSTATSSNYPTGRHSRYVGKVAVRNQWQRMAFELLDKPDVGASVTISKLILLFASNTFTGDTYYFDNLDSYAAGSSSAAPVVSITSPANNSTYPSGSVVTIQANATDSDGTISQVEFFANGNPIGSDNASPYSVNWTIGSGTYSITARASDNSGLSTTSSAVNVTGSSSTATSMYVASITTGTASAGGGSKFGTATITFRDNAGNPVPNATVTGTFSGSFSETKSGVTNSSGVATLTTTAKAKGTVTVNFCVSGVTHSGLNYDPAANVVTCSGGSASLTTSISAYPNPFGNRFTIQFQSTEPANVSASVYDRNGELIHSIPAQKYGEGMHELTVELSKQTREAYFVKVYINGQEYLLRQISNR